MSYRPFIVRCSSWSKVQSRDVGPWLSNTDDRVQSSCQCSWWVSPNTGDLHIMGFISLGGMVQYRQSLVLSFFFKFFLTLQQDIHGSLGEKYIMLKHEIYYIFYYFEMWHTNKERLAMKTYKIKQGTLVKYVDFRSPQLHRIRITKV